MKKRWLALSVLVIVLVLAAGLVIAFRLVFESTRPDWTTHSREAAEELEQGFDDLMRDYIADAVSHFEHALEIDPDLAVAKLFLDFVQPHGSAEHERLMGELRQVDLGSLKPREAYLLRIWLELEDHGMAASKAVLDEFLAAYPDDFFALQFRCSFAWEGEDWEGAAACYRRLLELYPNWYEAHDRLGTIALSQGRFSEAEEHFRTYRYIAPKEASPYVSLAQLLIVLGRYEEAEEEIAKALGIKGDYCDGHYQRLRLLIASGRFDEALEAVDLLETLPGCAGLVEAGVVCSARSLIAYLGGDFEKSWANLEAGCLERRRGFDVAGYHVALATGRGEAAAEMTAALERRRDEIVATGLPLTTDFVEALVAYAHGLERLYAGEVARAVDLFTVADGKLPYRDEGRINFKLWNRRVLLAALEMAGENARAEALRRQVMAVNPRLLDDIHLADVDELVTRGR